MPHRVLSELLTAEYLRPWAFWLFVPAVLFVLLDIVAARRTVLAALLRLLVFACLIFAFADPVRTTSSTVKQIGALVDMSASVSAPAKRALLEKLFEYEKDTKLLLIPFAGQAAAEPVVVDAGTSAGAAAERLKTAANKLNSGETDLAGGIRAGLAASASSSLFLLSDGFETVGSAKEAARFASASGVRIYPLIPDEALFREGRLVISSVYAPLTANAGEKVQVRATIKNLHAKPAQGELELWLDKEKLLSQQIAVPAGEERLVAFTSPVLKGGMHRLRAVLVPPHATAEQREKLRLEKHRWISVKEKAKILMISGTDEDERVLKELIRLKGYGLEHIIADGSTPIPSVFDTYSSVIINNAAKKQLPDGFLPALKGFVQNGGGLLLIGGDRSFGLGGYINTPLEEVSPLKFVPPTTEKRRLTVAVELLIDKSGSMADQNKIGAAKKAALLSIQALKDEDYVGVVGFDHAPFVIIDLKKAGEAKVQAEHRLQNLTAAGQTNPLPALSQARQSLRAIEASRKHIIVLSDGKFPLASDAYVEEINRLNREGVTVSAVALGVEADVPFMKILAKYGHGAFYHTLDPAQLPQIFLYDIKVSTGERTMKENQEFPVGPGPGGLVSTSVRNYPVLKGFVETLPKKGSTLELITSKEERLHPILASWKYEAGPVIAFTSDANGRWSLPWLTWKEFPNFWSEILSAIKDRSGNKAEDIDFDLRYNLNGKTLTFDLAVFDEKLKGGFAPKITAAITEPGGEVTQAVFKTEKKGRFTASIDNARPGDYKLAVSYGNVKLPALGMTLAPESFGEAPGRGINVQNLEEIAYLSGGSINPGREQVVPRERTLEEKEHLFLPFVIAAFILMLAEALLRESGFSLLRLLLQTKEETEPGRRPRGVYGPRHRKAA